MRSSLFPPWSQAHDPLTVEARFDEFVMALGGEKGAALLPKSPSFPNADYFFEQRSLVVELKSVETEFGRSNRFIAEFEHVMTDLLKTHPTWRPQIFGGEPMPKEFVARVIRLYRPPLARILKKANAQFKQTRKHFVL